jgi:hypothetical protein
VAKGTKDRRFAGYLDKNYQRSEALALASIYYCLEDIKDVSRQLKEDPLIRELADDAVLP